eukprot:546867_1
MGACESRQQEIEKAFKTLNKHPKKGRRKKKNDSNPFALSPTNSSSRSSSKTSSRASSSSSGVQSDDGTHQQDEKFEILESIAESVVESVAEMDISVNDMDGIIDDSENSVHDSDNMDGIIVNDLGIAEIITPGNDEENQEQSNDTDEFKVDVDEVVAGIEESDRKNRMDSHSRNFQHKCLRNCCKEYGQAQQHFKKQITKDQNDAYSRWIQFSLLPGYKPCPACANLITRRYNVNKRRSLSQIAKWGELDIAKLLDLQCNNGNLHINDLRMKDLAKIGYTCGTADFIYQVYTGGIDGKKLYKYTTKNKSMFNGVKCLMFELKKIAAFMQTLGIIGSNHILNVIEKIDDGQMSHQFIDNEKFIYNSRECGFRLRKSGGNIMSRLGAQYGILGAEHDKQQSNAEIGRKDGGRKKGGKNLLSLTIELIKYYIEEELNKKEYVFGCLEYGVFQINECIKLWSVSHYKTIECSKRLLKLIVHEFNDENTSVGNRTIWISLLSDLDELTKHLQRGKKGFRYKGQELYAEINPNAQDEDIEIETDLSLTEQGIMDNTKIYFFTD